MSPPISSVFLASEALVFTGNPNIVQDAATGIAIDGSSTPVIFSISPPVGIAGDITLVKFAITSGNAMDLTTFGGGVKLNIGITFRVKRSGGSFRNLFTYRDNFDLAIHGTRSTSFVPKAGNAIHGFGVAVVFAGQENRGVVLRLDGNLDEELQLIISELMDNTNSGNLSISLIAQGSLLQE